MITTSAQKSAIEARGNVLVAAGAGTGKTRTLVERCMALIESGVSLDRVLMVTFTEAAAVEMRSRIRRALLTRLEIADGAPATAVRHDTIRRQLTLLETAQISTMHSF